MALTRTWFKFNSDWASLERDNLQVCEDCLHERKKLLIIRKNNVFGFTVI